MTGIYLSGTGNTEHCIKKLLFLLDKTAQAVPMEQKDAVHLLSQHDFIVFAYPVQFSNVPVMVKDFIKSQPDLWKGKKYFALPLWDYSAETAQAARHGCSKSMARKSSAVSISVCLILSVM